MPQKLVVLIVCLLLSAEAFPAGEEELQSRNFDVSALLDARADPTVGRIGLGDAFTGWDDEEAPDERAFLDEASLEEILRRVVSPRKWSMDGFGIEWTGVTRLTVTATPEMLDAVGNLLGDLFLLAARRVEVRAELVTLDADGAGRVAAAGMQSALARGRLDAAARKALLAEAAKPGGSVEAGTISIRSGALAALAQTASVSYVGDIDVEIAQGSVVGDPIVKFATEGWLLNARPFVLSDGSVWLEAIQQRASFPEPMRHVNPEAAPLGTIDFPVVAQERFFAAGRVAPGETMAIYRRIPGGAHALVALLLTPVVLGDEPADGKVRFLPTAALTTRGLGAGSGWYDDESGEWSGVPAPSRAAFLSSPAMLIEKMEAPFADAGDLADELDATVVGGPAGLFTASAEATTSTWSSRTTRGGS